MNTNGKFCFTNKYLFTYMTLLSGSSDIGRSENEVSRMIFQSTCHVAMDSCNNNYHCRMSLSPILHHCDMSRCNRNSCMEALQAFYRKPSLPWNMEIAFCLCKYGVSFSGHLFHESHSYANIFIHHICTLHWRENFPFWLILFQCSEIVNSFHAAQASWT